MKARLYCFITLLLVSIINCDDESTLGPEYVDKSNETAVLVPVPVRRTPMPVLFS
jgi:hypothetical protein